MQTMAGRKRKRSQMRPLGGTAGPQQRVEWDGREFFQRAIPGQSANKPYFCPQCLMEIPVGEPHVVVWPADEADGIGQRRHWHTRCWQRRG
jgi:hypothetical protein